MKRMEKEAERKYLIFGIPYVRLRNDRARAYE